VTWDFTLQSDMFAQMGVNPVRGTVTAVIEMERIKSFMPVFDQETVSKLTIPGVNNHVVRPN